jgi:hypothetical protein
MRHADRPSVEEHLDVAAAPDRIWPLISDITFPVRPDSELLAAEWVDGAGDEPRVGRRFVGTNANRHFGKWQTTSTVIECEPPRVFAWAVGDPSEPNTTWRFTLEPLGTGTRVRQWVQLGVGPSGLGVAIERMPDKEERIVARRLEEFRAAMRANLEAVRHAAESG